jgi:flagellar basal body-associated protein FliL
VGIRFGANSGYRMRSSARSVERALLVLIWSIVSIVWSMVGVSGIGWWFVNESAMPNFIFRE